MSDLISRLAARTTGHSTTARPLTPSRFEAGRSAGLLGDVDRDLANEPDDPTPDVVDRTVGVLPSGEVGRGVAQRQRDRTEVDTTRQAHDTPVRSSASPRSPHENDRGDTSDRVATSGVPIAPDGAPAPSPADATAPLVTAVSPRQASSAAATGETRRSHTGGEPSGADRVVRAESVQKSTAPGFGSGAETATTPTVQVHIGRLDVRANLTAPPPAAPVTQRSEPTRSLQDYLDGKRSTR